MDTVFSYIVQKRLSQENENVATEALAFIVRSSERARSGLMKLLRGIAPDLPSLRFDTQQTKGSARPDMWGLDGGTPRAFIENKFWAGLTENQPVEYLRILAGHAHPSVLLMVVPEARLETVWRELKHRLDDAKLPYRDLSEGTHRIESIDFGPTLVTMPMLALTSWAKVLSTIDDELTDEPRTKNDLAQLRALCVAADAEYAPFSTEELTSQRTPSFFLHLNSAVQLAVDLSVTAGIVDIRRLNPTHFWEGHGRYIRFPSAMGIGAWLGTHFRFWRDHGSTPLWLYFSPKNFGRAVEVRSVLEPWAQQKGIAVSVENDGGYAVGVEVVAGEEPDHVVRSIADRLRDVAAELSRLSAKEAVTP